MFGLLSWTRGSYKIFVKDFHLIGEKCRTHVKIKARMEIRMPIVFFLLVSYCLLISKIFNQQTVLFFFFFCILKGPTSLNIKNNKWHVSFLSAKFGNPMSHAKCQLDMAFQVRVLNILFLPLPMPCGIWHICLRCSNDKSIYTYPTISESTNLLTITIHSLIIIH